QFLLGSLSSIEIGLSVRFQDFELLRVSSFKFVRKISLLLVVIGEKLKIESRKKSTKDIEITFLN
ncbi:unnamed protein product, partial [marine sediment metagenome]